MEKTETIQIEGMSCGHCVRTVEKALGEVAGVEVKAVQIGTAEVAYDASAVDRNQLVNAIEDVGFDVVADVAGA